MVEVSSQFVIPCFSKRNRGRQDIAERNISGAPIREAMEAKSVGWRVAQDAVTFVGRRFFSILQSEHVKPVPCMLWFQYPAAEGDVEDDVIVKSSAEYGSLFVDGIGEGMLWDAELLDAELLRESSFNLLQAGNGGRTG